MKPIIVINPNSTQSVTDGMDRTAERFRLNAGPDIECVTLKNTPAGIQTQEDINAVVEPISRFIQNKEESASAFIIGCYSDPGLREARAISSKPVLGIAESAMAVAITRGSKVGVISTLETSISRHLEYVCLMGLESRLAGERAIGLSVTELSNKDDTFARLVSVGRQLKEDDGADVLITGCAGMAPYKSGLEEAVGLPVIEPTEAAITLAIGMVLPN